MTITEFRHISKRLVNVLVDTGIPANSKPTEDLSFGESSFKEARHPPFRESSHPPFEQAHNPSFEDARGRLSEEAFRGVTNDRSPVSWSPTPAIAYRTASLDPREVAPPPFALPTFNDGQSTPGLDTHQHGPRAGDPVTDPAILGDIKPGLEPVYIGVMHKESYLGADHKKHIREAPAWLPKDAAHAFILANEKLARLGKRIILVSEGKDNSQINSATNLHATKNSHWYTCSRWAFQP